MSFSRILVSYVLITLLFISLGWASESDYAQAIKFHNKKVELINSNREMLRSKKDTSQKEEVYAEIKDLNQRILALLGGRGKGISLKPASPVQLENIIKMSIHAASMTGKFSDKSLELLLGNYSSNFPVIVREHYLTMAIVFSATLEKKNNNTLSIKDLANRVQSLRRYPWERVIPGNGLIQYLNSLTLENTENIIKYTKFMEIWDSGSWASKIN